MVALFLAFAVATAPTAAAADYYLPYNAIVTYKWKIGPGNPWPQGGCTVVVQHGSYLTAAYSHIRFASADHSYCAKYSVQNVYGYNGNLYATGRLEGSSHTQFTAVHGPAYSNTVSSIYGINPAGYPFQWNEREFTIFP